MPSYIPTIALLLLLANSALAQSFCPCIRTQPVGCFVPNSSGACTVRFFAGCQEELQCVDHDGEGVPEGASCCAVGITSKWTATGLTPDGFAFECLSAQQTGPTEVSELYNCGVVGPVDGKCTVEVLMEVSRGNHGDISWDLQDADGNEVASARAESTSNDPVGELQQQVAVLAGGSYRFHILDELAAGQFPNGVYIASSYEVHVNGVGVTSGLLGAEEYYNLTLTEDSCTAVQQDARSTFSINFQFTSAVDENLRRVFRRAAARWDKVIDKSLPDKQVVANGEIIEINDLLVGVTGERIDGVGGTLAAAGTVGLRGRLADYLPYYAVAFVDLDDYEHIQSLGPEAEDLLQEVVLHELGHALGINPISWDIAQAVVDGTYVGTNALREYQQYLVDSENSLLVSFVPLENDGGSGTVSAHFEEDVFGNELMTGFVNTGNGNPLSRVSIGSLNDLGYFVNYAAADDYQLPRTRSGPRSMTRRNVSDDDSFIYETLIIKKDAFRKPSRSSRSR
eukprot:CAMPEP_0198311116 /NCGR_PEP_ID=MMETSP1450-20131203/2943_1 /TAXON_ID=753684 ORGANISM="Madagascaria erythrocladiodes, Strain CCMP3234" /NCGR_SAMPLE_ID=MMETSP1450 /ASSEMBLY_ACC=CAM_ASM_001115 /LENGTH=509 /DNA_ID=CAMNT_0044013975 /DNA_START=90 /DNA_END=1619 /DNA_ORIENTATION=-